MSETLDARNRALAAVTRADDFIVSGKLVSRRRGQTAFGYRLLGKSEEPEANYGVAMNPDKATPVTFGAADRIIVLAED